MLKKILFSIMGILFVLFIYNNYIKKPVIIVIDEKNNVETENVNYNINDTYKIQAKEQKDDKDKNETHFKEARALFKDMDLKGKTAFIDKYKNMILEGNIVGKSQSGWLIKAEKIKYLEDRKKMSSDTKVTAVNEKEKLEFVADSFESETDFSVVKLDGNVRVMSEKMTVSSRKAFYNNTSSLIKFVNNIKFTGRNLNSGKGIIKKITGSFNYAIYDMNKKELSVWGDFTFFYQGFRIEGKNFIYDEDKGDLEIQSDIKVEKEDFNLKFTKLNYVDLDKKMTFRGPVKGNKGEWKFEGENAYLFTEEENLILEGRVFVYDKENFLRCDKLEYKSKLDEIHLYNKIEYTGKDKKLITDYAYANTEKKEVYIPVDFTFTMKDYEIKSKNFIYNSNDEKGSSDNAEIKNKNNILYADKIFFDMGNKKHILQGNIKGKYESYDLETDYAEIYQDEEKIYVKDKFKLSNKVEELDIYGKKGYVDNKNDRIYIEKGVQLFHPDYNGKGDILDYNIKEEEGNLLGNIEVIEKKNNGKMTGQKGYLKRGKTLKIEENVVVDFNDYRATSEEILYNSEEEKVYFNLPVKMENKLDDFIVNGENGYYDVNSEILYGTKIKGSKNEVKFEGDTIVYNVTEAVISLEQNVKIKKDDMEISSEALFYNGNTEEVYTEIPIDIRKGNLNINAKRGTINLANKTVKAEEVFMTTDEGDNIKGDKLIGNYNKRQFDFQGNIEGHLLSEDRENVKEKQILTPNNSITFKGELAKLFFIEELGLNNENEYIPTRSEIKNKAFFNYKDMDLTSDYLEFDLDKKLVFGKGSALLKADRDTEMYADYVYLDIDKEQGSLENNVKITDVSDQLGAVNTTADNAKFSNLKKEVELFGNVTTYQGQTKVVADTGKYDIVKNELQGSGGVNFKYFIDSTKNKEEKRKKEKETKLKLEEAYFSINLPKQITTEKAINLPLKFNDVNITWKSENEDLISEKGTVRRPEYGDGNRKVKLTAKFIVSKTTTEKAFNILVLERTANEALEEKLKDLKKEKLISSSGALILEEFEGIKIEELITSEEAINLKFTLGNATTEKAFNIENILTTSEEAISLSNSAIELIEEKKILKQIVSEKAIDLKFQE